jgi:hypothetical protein
MAPQFMDSAHHLQSQHQEDAMKAYCLYPSDKHLGCTWAWMSHGRGG